MPADNAASSTFLYNHFVTQASFPFPLIVHATFELTNNRQNLVESPANEYLAGRLVAFMAQVAEACGDASQPWRALSLISPQGDLDPILAKCGFRQALVVAARSRNVVPVRKGPLRRPSKCFRLRASVGTWLPAQFFEDIALSPIDSPIVSMVEALNIPTLSDPEFRARLNRISQTLSLVDRAALIAYLIKADILPGNPAPNLLIDDTQRLITPKYQTFMPPVERSSFVLPQWMSVRILNGELVKRLRAELSVSNPRDLATRMAAFHIREYSFASLAQAINARVNEKVREQPRQEREHRLAGLTAIYELYRQNGEDRATKRPEELHALLPTRTSKMVAATSLYFGNEYPDGALTEAIYASVKPDVIVGPPSMLPLGGSTADLASFLGWLGVANHPRTIRLPRVDEPAFVAHVLCGLEFPVSFEPPDYVAYKSADLGGCVISNLESMDGFEDILRYADPHVIVAWLALDPRFETGRTSGDKLARIKVCPPRKQNSRTAIRQVVPSYLLWRLSTQEWMPTSEGVKRAPCRCTVASNLPGELESIVPKPAIDTSHQAFRQLRIDAKAIRFALERTGVSRSLDDLTWDEVYSLLLELPRLDPAGQSARALYRVLIARPEGTEPPGGALRNEYLKSGRLWATCGTEAKYCRVSDGVYYLDEATVPEAVSKAFPLFALNRRCGVLKVQKLFGTRPLISRSISVSVNESVPSLRAEDLNAEVERLKPFIYAMRLSADQKGEKCSRLKKLRILLCRSARGMAKVGDAEIPIDLDLGEAIVVGEAAYLCAADVDDEHILRNELIADRVGEILADVLEVERGSDFARLASCLPSRRLELLGRILGTDPNDLLGIAKKKLETQESGEDRPEAGWFVPTPDAVHLPPPASALPPGEPAPQAAVVKTGVGPVSAKAEEHVPVEHRGKIQRRVRATPLVKIGGCGVSRVLDPGRCEELAERFEESDGQNRFPLSVAHLQGSEAYGCDILAFRSGKDREDFRGHPDLDLVARFIEVKARRSHANGIWLEGNELKAARSRLDRFYIYRVYEQSDGDFQILVLNDPLQGEPHIIYEIDVLGDSRTRKWLVKELPESKADSPG